MTLPINQIICGDCLEVMRGWPDNCVDLVLTDPPYGMNFVSNYRLVKYNKIVGDNQFPVWIFEEFKRIAKRAYYIFCRWDNLGSFPKPKSVLAWVKNNWSMGDLSHEHGRQWEAICFYAQSEHKFIKRIPDVIKGDRTGNELHPTQKPLSVMSQIIKANVGNIILDPFCGSGTTCVAAKMLGRSYIGIDISDEYCQIARERLRAVDTGVPVKEARAGQIGLFGD